MQSCISPCYFDCCTWGRHLQQSQQVQCNCALFGKCYCLLEIDSASDFRMSFCSFATLTWNFLLIFSSFLFTFCCSLQTQWTKLVACHGTLQPFCATLPLVPQMVLWCLSTGWGTRLWWRQSWLLWWWWPKVLNQVNHQKCIENPTRVSSSLNSCGVGFTVKCLSDESFVHFRSTVGGSAANRESAFTGGNSLSHGPTVSSTLSLLDITLVKTVNNLTSKTPAMHRQFKHALAKRTRPPRLMSFKDKCKKIHEVWCHPS